MSPQGPYLDRREAGKILARRIAERFDDTKAIVLALPRGGVPVGFEVASILELPLEIMVVRKLGAPQNPELAIGAIASGGYEALNDELVAQLGVTEIEIARIADRERAELQRREALYREDRAQLNLRGHPVILVDDGLATGFTMRVAVAAARDHGAASLVVAVPVGAQETCDDIAKLVDDLICPLQPDSFRAVGLWYNNFQPTGDDEVSECLKLNGAHAKNHGRNHRG